MKPKHFALCRLFTNHVLTFNSVTQHFLEYTEHIHLFTQYLPPLIHQYLSRSPLASLHCLPWVEIDGLGSLCTDSQEVFSFGCF